MRYLLPLLFILGACQAPTQQDADGSTPAVAILTSNVINDGAAPLGECLAIVEADCDKMDAADCPMAGEADCDKMDAADCPMAGEADCDKAYCVEGAACCEQGKCEEE